SKEPGIRSYYLLELTGLARGVLLVAHTDAAPRGFTLLCRQLGARVAEVASTVLGFGLTREWTASESARLQSEFAALEGGALRRACAHAAGARSRTRARSGRRSREQAGRRAAGCAAGTGRRPRESSR